MSLFEPMPCGRLISSSNAPGTSPEEIRHVASASRRRTVERDLAALARNNRGPHA